LVRLIRVRAEIAALRRSNTFEEGRMLLWGDTVDIPFCRTPRRLERLAALIDGALERAELQRVSAHARTCEDCRRVLEEARALLATEDALRQV
jgi:hypothetical protein